MRFTLLSSIAAIAAAALIACAPADDAAEHDGHDHSAHDHGAHDHGADHKDDAHDHGAHDHGDDHHEGDGHDHGEDEAANVDDAAPQTADAEDAAAKGIAIEQAWVRAAPAGRPVSAGYLLIRNDGETTDSLVGVSSPVAEAAEIHVTKADAEGIMRMRVVPALEIPAGGKASFEPAGNHLMLVGLKGEIAEGAEVPVTLTFEQAGDIDITLLAKGGGDAHGH